MANKKGTSQGDFSRFRFDPRRHYSAVHMQQGRVMLDADWNAQVDIVSHHIRTGASDMIGAHGAPAASAGFGVRVEGCLELGPEGHYLALGDAGGGLTWPDMETIEGYTLEIRLQPVGEGALLSRWVAGVSGFQLADLLLLEEGRLRFERAGTLDDLVSEPLDLVSRDPAAPPRRIIVACGAETTTIYLDGQVVAEDAGGLLGAGGHGSSPIGSRLLIGVHFEDGRPCRRLAGRLFGVRLWADGQPVSGEPEGESVGESVDGRARLLGDWPLDDGSGAAVGDRSIFGHHGLVEGGILVEGAEAPPRWHAVSPTVTAGRYYVDGILCENERVVGFEQQPDLPGAVFPAAVLTGGAEEPQAGPVHHLFYLDVWQRSISAFEDPELREVALGGSTTTTRSRTIAQVRSLAVSASAKNQDEARDLPEWRRLTRDLDHRGRLRACRRRTSAATLDNLLYRVEIHHGGGCGVHLASSDATFKWSRNNASATYPILELTAGNTSLALDGSISEPLCLRAGTWVEVIDDTTVLRRQPGHLCRVTSFDAVKWRVVLEQSPPDGLGSDPSRHPQLRVWDQLTAADQAAEGDPTRPGIPVIGGDWQSLEDGIEVAFEDDGDFVSGDYWWIVARHPTQDVEWPRDAHGRPRALPPNGVGHHLTPLAGLTHEGGGFRLTDLRRTFHDLASGAVSKAGDAMEGPLDVRADLSVGGDLEVAGVARLGEIHGSLASHGIVGAEQLAAGSVTLRHLAAEVGVVPVGFSILGPRQESPPGWTFTGVKNFFVDEARWIDRFEIPHVPRAPMRAVTLDGRVFALLETGDLWEYDPATNTARRRRQMPEERHAFAVAAANGEIYVFGGQDAAGRCLGSTLAYDPQFDQWSERSPMPTARCAAAAAVFDGRVHVLGGLRRGFFGGRSVTVCHQVFDPLADAWIRAAPLPTALSSLGAAALGTQIHIVGGERRKLFRRWRPALSARHQSYHPASDTWLPDQEPLPTPRCDPRLVEVHGRLYAVGGRSALGWLADCDRYDAISRRWTPLTELHESVDGPGVAAVDGALYVIGARRGPEAEGVLVEESTVALRFFIHRREQTRQAEDLQSPINWLDRLAEGEPGAKEGD